MSNQVEFIVFGDSHADIRAKADAILDQHGVPMAAEIHIRATAMQPTVDLRVWGYEANVIAVWGGSDQ